MEIAIPVIVKQVVAYPINFLSEFRSPTATIFAGSALHTPGNPNCVSGLSSGGGACLWLPGIRLGVFSVSAGRCLGGGVCVFR